MTRVWLIRHGEPIEEARNQCYGSTDFGLSEMGRAQMARVAEYFRAEPIATIYSSPLSRALESARILAGAAPSRPIQVVDDLREMDFGAFEGLAYDDIAARDPVFYRQWMETPTEVHFPGGESFAEMRVRVLAAFEKIHREEEEGTTAIVSHGGVNRILIAWALQMPGVSLFRVAQDYGAINLLTLEDGFPCVRLLNHCPAAV